MQRLLKGILSVFLFLIPFFVSSQVVFEQKFDIHVNDGERDLGHPWGGGLNSSQYNKADLDGDGKEELILYDRSANIYQIFNIEGDNFIPSNELCVLLPQLPAGWVLFVDYNQDGKKDIFSNGERGIIVLKNVSQTGQPVQWEKVADPLFTTGYSGKINLIANAADVPAITDIDSDGDMDILVYNFAIGGYIRYNKNLSQELFGNADSLEYEINTRRWGEFEECDCNVFTFSGETCADLSNGRVMHPGGKALLAIDADGDGDRDLLVGHEQCEELYFYENMGDKDSAYMVDYSNMFPDDIHPANFHVFPAGYFEDLDFDGVKDLIVTPSFEENVEFKIDFAHSNWFYKNTGTNAYPDFIYQQNDLIQHQMMDFGENSMPALYDLNVDGKTDLLLAVNGHWNGSYFGGYVIEFENTGSSSTPSFRINDKNYIDLASLNLINPKINLVDFNEDSAVDLVYTGMQIQDFKLVSWLIFNQVDSGQPVSFNINEKKQIELPPSMAYSDTPTFFDIDEDSYVDLLAGKGDGALEYHRNKGDNTFELIDASFLGIERDFSQERIHLVASIGDIDMNGEADLITTDFSGEGRVYFDFQKQIDTEPTYVDLSYSNGLTNKEESIKFDLHSWISSADLFNQG
ncbi:MAG: VCBS repeat-containing protein, partial [Cyclobacteriaceae bacterium]|nr:VCBS repeat-containing protein [Cyclobacteriaceae bacterium]